jgi:CheY-like chemotaxis protein
MEIREEEFQIKKIAQSIEDIFSQVAKKNQNTLNISIDKAIPPILRGDSARLTQIMFNLVGNAMKYTRQGIVDVEANLLSSPLAEPCRILFTVSDTGQGIPEGSMDEIFDAFTQAEDARLPYTRRYEGAGLGLPLVKRLVRLMGGNVSITSKEGEGTVVYVSLPFKIPGNLQHEQYQQAYTKEKEDSKAKKVLLAEDDEATQLLVTRLLEKYGIEVHVAEDGEKVISELARNSYDCILMDIQMPRLDGFEATKRIRSSRAGFKSIPIIAMTAYAMTGDREKFLQAGMDDYIAKPVNKDDLLEVISKHLSGT